MRINKKLRIYADYNPTKESRQEALSLICEQIDKGTFTMPIYQRDLSWSKQKQVDLFNYQLLGSAPVSAISINVITNIDTAVSQISFIDREVIKIVHQINSVIDGQQRLTTNYKAYIGSNDIDDIVLDLSRGKFLKIDDVNKIKSNQIPVGILYNKDSSKLSNYKKINTKLADFEISEILMQVRSKFMNYYYTINQAKDLTEDKQIEWFEVLNNAGSKVTEIQMKFAKLKSVGIDIYTEYTRKFDTMIEEHGYDNVFISQTTYMSYPICALCPAYEVITGQEHQKNYCPMAPDVRQAMSICNLTPKQLRLAFDMTLQALKRTLDFIEEYTDLEPSRIDYINFLVGYFVFHPEALNKKEIEGLKKWYTNLSLDNSNNTERRDIFVKLINKKFILDI